ncbi:MAG: hypothetical protein CMP30_10905 [Roseibacillus sp.]|nr:hypothetical protein [Roseibacillus sp.]
MHFFVRSGLYATYLHPVKRKSVIGHACWAAVTAGAFASGLVLDRNGVDQPSAVKLPRAKSSRGAGGEISGNSASRSVGLSGSLQLSGGQSLGGVTGVEAGALSQPEIAALAKEAFRSGNPLVRRSAFDQLLGNLTAENAQDMLVHLKENRVGGEQWRDFHYLWGTLDGKAAVDHSLNSEERDLSHTMSGWASSYPDAAINYINNLSEEDRGSFRHLQEAMVSGMADNDTARATDYVLQLANQGDDRANHLFGVVTKEVVSNVGIDEAAQWSQSLPDGDLKGAALDTVAHRFTNSDPEAAAQWVEQFAGQAYADRAIEEVGDEWAERDPASAVNWLETIQEGRGQSMGLHSAFGEWAQRDPVAAGERITSMERSPQRDAAISGFARRISYDDPGAAIEWANSIADEGSRSRALTHAGQQLFRRDRAAAEAWVGSSGLSPEAQQAVRNPPNRRR